MIIGLDFDGVIARELAIPKWLPVFLIRLMLAFAPEMAGLEVARRLGQRHRLVVVTSRPVECAFVTRLWLRLHRVPFAALHCVGLAGDKVLVLRKEQVEVYFDDKPRYVEAASRQGITAHLFQSWNQVAEILGLAECGQGLGFLHRLISSSGFGRRLKKRIVRWVANCPECQTLWQSVIFADNPREEIMVNKERVLVRKLARPLRVFHVTSREAKTKILATGLRPSTNYARYADKANVTLVSFALLSRRQARRFVLMASWPFRLVFDFRTTPKNQIVEVVAPVETRVGITSWNEVVVLDAIPPENINHARP